MGAQLYRNTVINTAYSLDRDLRLVLDAKPTPSFQPHHAMAENKRERNRHEDRKENPEGEGKIQDRLRGREN